MDMTALGLAVALDALAQPTVKPRIRRALPGFGGERSRWQWECRTRWGIGFGMTPAEAWDNWTKWGRDSEPGRRWQ